MVFAADGQGRLTYASEAAREVLGIPAPEAVGQALVAILHPDDAAPNRAAWERLAAGSRSATSRAGRSGPTGASRGCG